MRPRCAGSVRYGWSDAPGERGPVYDVAIIGAGVVGCALAYRLSAYRLRIALVDQNWDVGEGTSKANSAIIHTGFDATPGSLESQLVTRASRMWPAVANKLKIPLLQSSALLLAMDDDQAAELPVLHERAIANGVDDVELVGRERAIALEPNVNPRIRGGLLIPRESIVDPFTATIAFAEVALANGADIYLGTPVASIDLGSESSAPIRVVGADPGAELRTRIAVNVAGLGGRALAAGYGAESFDINPRRGQFVVFDRHARPLLTRILLPIPTKRSKGMLVAPTVFGNLLAGPTAEDLDPGQCGDTRTTVAGVNEVRANATALCPALARQPIIASYSGLRCNCAQGSYWIRFADGHPGLVTVSGVRSTGLTASIALADHLIDGMARECGMPREPRAQATDRRDERCWPGWWRSPWEDPERLRDRPEYGAIVCSCENISRGEIVDALDSPLAPRTLDAIKRRTRAMTGRCQAFQCGVATARIIAAHRGVPLDRISKRGPGSEFVVPSATGSARDVSLHPSSARPGHERPSIDRYRVVVVGAGPAGIGVAVGLARRGVAPILIVDRADEPGGVPAKYAAHEGSVPTFVVWTRGRIVRGGDYARELVSRLERAGPRVWLESQVVALDADRRELVVVRPGVGRVVVSADAVVLASGAREKTLAERGWIAGWRPARVFPTMQVLDLLDGEGCVPMTRPLILGSDLIAHATAAKLRSHGSEPPVLVDCRPSQDASWPARRYFARWGSTRWHGDAREVEIHDRLVARAVHTPDGPIACDGVVVSGELVPNSELAVEAGLAVELPGRRPVLNRGAELSAPGWFVAGNVAGGFHGAEWCYHHGRRVARRVCAYLERSRYHRSVTHGSATR